MKVRVFVVCFCVVGFALPAIAAQAYRAINWLYVVPMGNDTFEVIEDRGAGPRGIWCAAADYAQKAGLDGLRKRMYVLEPRGPSRTVANEIGVVFTVNPDEQLKKTPSSYSVGVKTKGENLTISHARNFCDITIDDVFDRF